MKEQVVDTILRIVILDECLENFISSFNSAISFSQRNSLKILRPFEIEDSNFLALLTDGFLRALTSSPYS